MQCQSIKYLCICVCGGGGGVADKTMHKLMINRRIYNIGKVFYFKASKKELGHF